MVEHYQPPPPRIIHQGEVPRGYVQGPPVMHQGPPIMHQGPPVMHQGLPVMHQGPPGQVIPGAYRSTEQYPPRVEVSSPRNTQMPPGYVSPAQRFVNYDQGGI